MTPWNNPQAFLPPRDPPPPHIVVEYGLTPVTEVHVNAEDAKDTHRNWHWSDDGKFRMLDNRPNSPINREQLAEWNELKQQTEVKKVLFDLLSRVQHRNEEVPAARPDTLSRHIRNEVVSTLNMLCNQVRLRSEREREKERERAYNDAQLRLLRMASGAPVDQPVPRRSDTERRNY